LIIKYSFIIDYQIKIDDDDFTEGPTIKEEHFRFSISTKRLLKLMSEYSNNIHTDSTYKLIWNNFLVLITGFTDNNNRFHPELLSISRSEDCHDYQFLFESIQKGINIIGMCYININCSSFVKKISMWILKTFI
jgi:hypothetical protein